MMARIGVLSTVLALFCWPEFLSWQELKIYIDLIRETKIKMKYGTVTKFSSMDFVLQ